MSKILALAGNTYREAIRQKVLYSLLFFSFVMIVASYFLAQLSVGGVFEKIVKDVGLFSVFFFGIFISITMGVSLVFKEVDRRTIYTILSKPVSRFEFVLGKYLGLTFVVLIETVLMMIAFYIVLAFYTPHIQWVLLKSAYLMFVEFCIIIAICLVFSSYSSSLMSSLFAFSLFVLGHLSDSFAKVILSMAKKMEISSNMVYVAADLVEFFNLDMYIVHTKIVHGMLIPPGYLWKATLYGLAWIVLCLILSMLMFRRKDLK
ncbi:MAG: ABC transporter permease subunit [Deltaproteobacteria bacterium]|nr:ABC transporter permease subunit [Deltaproteobacteria bacterium]